MPKHTGFIPPADIRAKPRIVCAALLFKDGEQILAPRHHQALMHAFRAKKGERIQGFVDQFEIFYTRTEAYEIAVEAGQIERRPGEGHELFSEDLY